MDYSTEYYKVLKILDFLWEYYIMIIYNIFYFMRYIEMLRLILWLLAVWVIEIILNVWWSIVYFLSEFIKLLLLFLFIWALLSAFEWNRLPIILVIWLPVAWIIYVMYRAKNRINLKNYINKKEKKKVVLDDSDFVEVIDSI